MSPQIVLDTNVLFSGLYSPLGASFEILKRINAGEMGIHLSVPLIVQYQDVLKRSTDKLSLDAASIDIIIDRLCSIAKYHEIHYLWRPLLPDYKDDLVLELAVTAQCSHIVTHNVRDFKGAESFGIDVVSPIEFISELGDRS